ncbi:MAG: hypothetical protein ABI729_10965, partial [Chitinophagales bacterium]
MKYLFILLCILIFACTINSNAQTALPDSSISERVITLDETVVSANKVPEEKKNVAQQIEVISE